MTSYMKTAVLLAGMTALFMAIGFAIGGQGGMMIALMLAIGTNLFAYWNSGNMVLSMYGARQVDASTAPALYNMVQDLARRAGLPMPRVLIIENDQPNAFATGRNPENAAVAATTGLLRTLTPEEVAGVMAHELAHVKNRDTLVMTVTATLAGAISMIANFGMFAGMSGNRNGQGNALGAIGTILLAVLAPMAAMVVQMAISRTREYEADRIGAEICGQPIWLANALTNIHNTASRIPNEAAEANPATAHLFITNPLHGRSFDSLFSTHPAMQERVRRLHVMAATMGGGMPGGDTQPQPQPQPQPQRPPQHPPRQGGPWGNGGNQPPASRRRPWG